mmetsp:Transcript_37440/g.97070  ORF Transcript_37440/g.97070 Transcript_37440/m.97070 type:complete len:368 (+) Transcript_37440:179-1282(+)
MLVLHVVIDLPLQKLLAALPTPMHGALRARDVVASTELHRRGFATWALLRVVLHRLLPLLLGPRRGEHSGLHALPALEALQLGRLPRTVPGHCGFDLEASAAPAIIHACVQLQCASSSQAQHRPVEGPKGGRLRRALAEGAEALRGHIQTAGSKLAVPAAEAGPASEVLATAASTLERAQWLLLEAQVAGVGQAALQALRQLCDHRDHIPNGLAGPDQDLRLGLRHCGELVLVPHPELEEPNAVEEQLPRGLFETQTSHERGVLLEKLRELNLHELCALLLVQRTRSAHEALDPGRGRGRAEPVAARDAGDDSCRLVVAAIVAFRLDVQVLGAHHSIEDIAGATLHQVRTVLVLLGTRKTPCKVVKA